MTPKEKIKTQYRDNLKLADKTVKRVTTLMRQNKIKRNITSRKDLREYRGRDSAKDVRLYV